MKADIHPDLHPVIFRDASAGKDFFAWSVMTSDETKTVKGTKYYVIHLDVSSASHPFYTGKQKFVDTSGRVKRFERMTEKSSTTTA